MSLETDISSMYKHTKDVYDSLGLLGGTLPENKNLENLATAFDNLSIVPEVPDLSQVLTKDDFDKLQAIVATGRASEYLNLGDELKVTYGNYVMPFEIVGFEPVEVEGGETVHAINLLSKYISETGTAWGNDVNAKYSASTLRTSITMTYQNKLDAIFVNCLGNTKVLTYNQGGTTDIVYDKLFAPSMAQLGVSTTGYYQEVEGPTFTAYVGATNSKRRKVLVDRTSTYAGYWTRSKNSINYFALIDDTGAPYAVSTGYTYGVVAACNFVATSTPAPVNYTVTFQADGAENVPAPQTVPRGGQLASQLTQ